jgi:tetratricopeptide repeat protein
LRNELHPKGFEVVTIALDTEGLPAARYFIERAEPEHPSLVDQTHLMDELFGVVNVPSGVWIDEEGMIVRPPEPAFPDRLGFKVPEGLADLDPYIAGVLEETKRIRHDRRYVGALRDWVDNGARSQYALTPDEVVERSRPRPREVGLAAAHFELGQHLWREGKRDDAIRHLREAHRLQPDNWTYKRQAWSFVNPVQAPSAEFEGDWLGDVRKIGAENYYPELDL